MIKGVGHRLDAIAALTDSQRSLPAERALQRRIILGYAWAGGEDFE
jgi:predicted transcriptional regulator